MSISESMSDGDLLRMIAEGTRAQIPEVTTTYGEVLIMQAMADRVDAIAKRLDDPRCFLCDGKFSDHGSQT